MPKKFPVAISVRNREDKTTLQTTPLFVNDRVAATPTLNDT
jgi:hypothetical protein